MGKKISKPKKLKNTEGIPLAVVSVNGGVCLLEKTLKKTGNHLFLSWSTDGLNFSGDKRQVEIKISPRKKEKIETCSNFSLSGPPTSFIMTMSEPGKPEIKIFLSLPNQKICMLGQLNRKLFAATQIKPLLSMTSYWTFSYFTKTAYFLNASKPEH